MANINIQCAYVHEQYAGKLAEFDDVRQIMHTVEVTIDNEPHTLDLLAEDPMHAIEKARKLSAESLARVAKKKPVSEA